MGASFGDVIDLNFALVEAAFKRFVVDVRLREGILIDFALASGEL